MYFGFLITKSEKRQMENVIITKEKIFISALTEKRQNKIEKIVNQFLDTLEQIQAELK